MKKALKFWKNILNDVAIILPPEKKKRKEKRGEGGGWNIK